MKLLHIDSSIQYEPSVTRAVTRAVVKRFQDLEPGLQVAYHDLCSSPLPALTLETLPGAHPLAVEPKTEEARQARLEADAALQAFLDADIVVIGAPMYDFSVPSLLKGWMERICVAGTTFKYGPEGPIGLAAGKRAVVVVARGGMYGPGTPGASAEHAETAMRTLLGFLGMEVDIIVAEGIGFGEEARNKALDQALHAAAGLTL